METTILFQHPSHGLAESAEAVVTSQKIRVRDRVFDLTSVAGVSVELHEIRWARIGTIVGGLAIGGMMITAMLFAGQNTQGLPCGIFLLIVGGLLLYTTSKGNKWAYWNGVVHMRQTEDTIMSGDVKQRFCILIRVEKHIAEAFTDAVRKAIAARDSSDEG